MVDFVRNITTGSIERMCTGERWLHFVMSVKEDGHFLLDIPHDISGVEHLRVFTYGNYESFYTGDRTYRGDVAAGNYSSWVLDQYGLFPTNQIGITFHSFDSDSLTYRVPFLKDDVVYRVSLGHHKEESGAPMHVREKYAVPFTPAPPLVQSQLVPPEDVLCRDNLVLAFKLGTTACHESAYWIRDNSCSDIGGVNYTAVCVRPSSLEALVERGVLHAEIPPLR